MSTSGLPAKSLPKVHSAQKVARSASSWRCEGQALPCSLSFNDLEYSRSPLWRVRSPASLLTIEG